MAMRLIALLVLACSAACTAWAPSPARIARLQCTSLHANINTPSHPHSPLDVRSKALSKTLPTAAALLSSLLIPRLASATTEFLKEPTADFQAAKASAGKRAAEDAKVRADWDALLASFEKSETPAELEAAIRALRVFLLKIPAQIPSGVKKIDLVKKCRAKKTQGLPYKKGSKKAQPNWTTKVCCVCPLNVPITDP